jgi:hypothetical protein
MYVAQVTTRARHPLPVFPVRQSSEFPAPPPEFRWSRDVGTDDVTALILGER